MKTKADVLIITVTPVESHAVIEVFQNFNKEKPQPVTIADRMYHSLGEVNEARVYMGISEMGAVGPGGSQESIRKGIEALSPNAVILVGIAFGLDKKKQAIGEVLISKILSLYELSIW